MRSGPQVPDDPAPALPEMKVRLTEIEDAISAIRFYTKGMTYEDLLLDRKTRDAILLNFMVIGSGILKIPPDVIGRFPEVPWQKFAGMGEAMARGNFSMSPAGMWETVQHDLSPVAVVVQNLLMEK